ncbi:hypothetical protein [Candidatus Methanocrinis natronophilus]|uniref:Uncharacterized protein n=1 Tax=Candidatus Methanocrinis natronophilus TaxID=3033396 RepID=A0ABT5X682_9EURY|nr:hypothetical protein [Candidatus Methanocrinis natronophilus]MDF0590207.1 hypothetical protein [Candidatus Methanocrinis natronophilus]
MMLVKRDILHDFDFIPTATAGSRVGAVQADNIPRDFHGDY